MFHRHTFLTSKLNIARNYMTNAKSVMLHIESNDYKSFRAVIDKETHLDTADIGDLIRFAHATQTIKSVRSRMGYLFHDVHQKNNFMEETIAALATGLLFAPTPIGNIGCYMGLFATWLWRSGRILRKGSSASSFNMSKEEMNQIIDHLDDLRDKILQTKDE